MRSRIYQALNGKSRSGSTISKLGTNIETSRKWIECQMTPVMNRRKIEVDHVKLICLLDVSKDEELKEASSSKNTQLLLKRNS